MPLTSTIHARHTLAHLHRIEAQRDQAGGSANRRVFRRFTIRGEATLRPANRHARHDAAVEVHLRDVGRGGLGFTCDHPLPENSLWVASFTREGIVLAEHTLQVRHIRAIDGGGCYLHGCMFVLGDGTLALLGVEPHDIDQSCCDNGQSPDDSVGDFVLPDTI